MTPNPAAPTPTQRLHANLLAQTSLADELSTLIAAERERMVARDWDAILRLTEDKAKLIQRLQVQGRELEQLAAGKPVAEVIAAHGLTDVHQTLMDRAARLQRANREARALLDHHQGRVDSALRSMNRGDGTGVYGRNGYAGNGRVSQKLAAA